MIQAVDALLALLETAEASANRLNSLAYALDDLLCAYHRTDAEAFEAVDFPEAPLIEYKIVRDLVQTRFSGLCFYHHIAPETADNDFEPVMGDAVDDLADIYIDLKGIEWRWANTSHDDAIWNFRFSFEAHWGRHLIDLRSFLHYKMFGN